MGGASAFALGGAVRATWQPESNLLGREEAGRDGLGFGLVLAMGGWNRLAAAASNGLAWVCSSKKTPKTSLGDTQP